MTNLHVEAEGTAKVAPAAVWPLVADATRYCEWGPWNASGYESPDADTSAGTVRWMRYGRTTTVERMLEVDSGRRIVYTVLRGIPVRNYRAELTLTPDGSGTHIRWVADWDRTLGGRLVHLKLRTLYPQIVAALIAAAER
jgi:uncharacterized protein YndB with AHSA1/START domain